MTHYVCSQEKIKLSIKKTKKETSSMIIHLDRFQFITLKLLLKDSRNWSYSCAIRSLGKSLTLFPIYTHNDNSPCSSICLCH